jgi:hypothetical protein
VSGEGDNEWIERAADFWVRGTPGASGSETIMRVGRSSQWLLIRNDPPRVKFSRYGSLEDAKVAAAAGKAPP